MKLTAAQTEALIAAATAGVSVIGWKGADTGAKVETTMPAIRGLFKRGLLGQAVMTNGLGCELAWTLTGKGLDLARSLAA